MRAIFLTAFTTVLLAELGDKTQLATFGLAAEPGRKLAVFLGASAALVASSALAVLAGDTLGRWLNPRLIKAMAGALFLVLGFFYVRDAVMGG